jgi:hypothetical protein
MKKRQAKTVKRAKPPDSLELLRAVLRKRTKDELIEVVLEWARDSRTARRQLEARFDVEPPDQQLVADTRQAIADATAFDERKVNYNFDYDYQAYETVQRNFRRLTEARRIDQAMDLSLELMGQGSYQVEMSDEGLMADDLCACLQVVIGALGKSNVPPREIVAWCDAMQRQDRVGFICRDELRALRNLYAN